MKIELRYISRDTREPLSARGCLKVLWNGWLSPDQITRAKAFANDPSHTEEDCEKELRRLEEAATEAHDFWEFSQ